MPGGTQKPPLDPSAVLQNLASTATSAKGKAREGGGSAWGYVVAFVVMLLGVGVFWWIARKNNQELADLRHEKNKTKILADKAELLAQIAKGDEQVAIEKKKVDAAEETLRIIEADIRAEEARYEANMRAIDRIRSWDDILDSGS